MKRQNPSPLVVFAALSLGAIACSKQPRPLYASSAGQGTYALGYVESLASARTEVATVETQVEASRAEFAAYPDALSNPSWPDVMAVYSAADEAGRTAGYVEELERDEVVARFYVEEKDELNRRVGGAAQYAAKQKNCDVELSGPTSYALNKGFEERLRDRLRDHSEAYRYIVEHEDALGKKNRPKLEEQSDAISRVSYLAHVAIARLRERMALKAAEGSDVDKTLQRVADEEHRRAADDKAPAAQRAKSTEREQAAITARGRVAPEVAEAKKLSDQMEQREKAVRDKYDATFAALRQAVEARAKAK